MRRLPLSQRFIVGEMALLVMTIVLAFDKARDDHWLSATLILAVVFPIVSAANYFWVRLTAE